MEIIHLKSGNISTTEVRKVVDVLKNGGLVVFPTDTVYGLAGDANNNSVIKKICDLKLRPKDKPFVVFISDVKNLNELNIKITSKIKKLLDVFWPGAVTFIFKKESETIAIRIPDYPVVLSILKEFNGPLVVTSANISGKEPPSDFDQIEAGILKNVDLAINAGKCPVSVASTIVDVSGKELKILREGAISSEVIRKTRR